MFQNNVNRDQFVQDPALLRERAEARRAAMHQRKGYDVSARCTWLCIQDVWTRSKCFFVCFFRLQLPPGAASQQRGGSTQRPGPEAGDGPGPTQEGGRQGPRRQPQPPQHGRPQEEQRHDPVVTCCPTRNPLRRNNNPHQRYSGQAAACIRHRSVKKPQKVLS